MQSKRVLLLYVSPDSGHHRASLAIEKALHEHLPECNVLNVNALHYMNPVLERVIKKTYFGLIRTHPEVWEYLYDNPKIAKSTQRLRHFIHRFNSPKFQLLLNNFKPDVIICTQAFPCGVVSDIKKSKRLSIYLIGVTTDYFPHSYWLYENVDFYVVSSEKAKTKLVRDGILKEKILTYGIPIDPKFCVDGKKEQTILHYQLDPKLPILLLMGGSQGMGPIWKVVKALDQCEFSLQMIIVCGKNKHLYRQLDHQKRRFEKRTLVFGFVNDVDALMEIATLLITKPGGVTTAEALSKNLPLILLNPIRGQETSNANFLVEEGVAVKADDAEEVVVLARELLSHPTKLNEMGLHAARHKKSRSAFDVAQFILSL